MNWEVEQKSEAENGNDLVYWTEADVKRITDDADVNGSFQSSEEENQEITRKLWEQKQMNEELTGQTTHQTEEASLQCENS